LGKGSDHYGHYAKRIPFYYKDYSK